MRNLSHSYQEVKPSFSRTKKKGRKFLDGTHLPKEPDAFCQTSIAELYLMHHNGMINAEAFAYFVAKSYGGGDNRNCFASSATIADRGGISERSVQRGLKRAESAGLFEVVENTEHSTPDRLFVTPAQALRALEDLDRLPQVEFVPEVIKVSPEEFQKGQDAVQLLDGIFAGLPVQDLEVQEESQKPQEEPLQTAPGLPCPIEQVEVAPEAQMEPEAIREAFNKALEEVGMEKKFQPGPIGETSRRICLDLAKVYQKATIKTAIRFIVARWKSVGRVLGGTLGLEALERALTVLSEWTRWRKRQLC